MTARVEPVAAIPADLLAKAEEAAGGVIRSDAAVYRTLANHPELLVAWLALGGHVLRDNALAPELRELAILRTVMLADGRYPAAQHLRIARAEGVPQHHIDRVAADPRSAGWDRATTASLVAIDQLRHSGSIDDVTMNELKSYHGVDGALDLIATAAFYRMAAWLLNACRTPLDDGQPPPEIAGIERADLPIAAGGPAEPSTANVGIDPLPLDRWPTDLVDRTATWPRFAGRPEIRRAGVYCTLANHPPLLIALGPIMAHLLVDNTLTDRQREVVIVRSCLLDRGAYPYRQHVGIAAAAGVDQRSLDELTGPEPTLDDPVSSAIVAAVDDLHRHDDIADPTWSELVRHIEPKQIMDIVATAGFYGLISFVLNSARTPLESGTVVLPPTPLPKGPR